MKVHTKIYFSVFILLSVLTFFLLIQFSRADTGGVENLVGPVLKVYFFDVGQGDSVFIKTPQGKDILIDGGPDNTVLERLGEVLPYWDRQIDLMVLTHPHADHIQGLDSVLKNYQVGKIVETDLKTPTSEGNYFDKLALLDGATEQKVIKGENINIENDINLEVLYPLAYQLNEEDLNDDSVVIKLTYAGKSFLLTGDATVNVESKIEDQYLKADFLKVAHHGSRYASSEKFLELVHPAVSIISVGAGNSFGHPTRDTLNRLTAIGSRILRTDNNGTIEVDVGSDGQWVINCTKTCN